MIQVANLRVRLGRAQILDGLGFQVGRGQSLALWGQNGAGKTTVIRALLGLVPFEGKVRLAGLAMPTQGRAARAAVGYVPQQLAYDQDMDCLGLLRFFGAIRGAPAEAPRALLVQLGLEAQAAKAVGALSGGMKQRLALAAALLGDPPILFLDEPTANLDAAARAELTSLIAELRAAGKTLLLTTHRLAEVAALADRVLVLEGGRVRGDCAAEGLAQFLGLPARLALRLEGDTTLALRLLDEAGFKARANGVGLRVEAPAGRHGAPLALLASAGITILDAQLEEGS